MPRRSFFAVVLLAIGHRLDLIRSQRDGTRKATHGAFVADEAVAFYLNAKEQCVVVAVGDGFENAQAISAGLALHPELLAGAAPEGDKAGFEGRPVAFGV